MSNDRYRYIQEDLRNGRSRKNIVYQDDNELDFKQFLTLLSDNKSFRSFFINLLADVPFRAYHWETPPVTVDTAEQDFEFVATRSPAIDLPPSIGPFAQYFTGDDPVAVFDNLGGDAKLIAPAPTDPQRNYSHIGVFTDNAPVQQQHALWQRVGQVMLESLSEKPIWLNTAGGGVAWLHVRLDSSPKYYRYQPYTSLS